MLHLIYSFDVRHMPQGCGTWPAIWEAGLNDWPNEGEVDILEGVNNVGPNAVSVHTSLGCSMPANRVQAGTGLGTDCGAHSDNDPGCGVTDPFDDSFGPSFNNNGGGWFAIERTESFIKVWFWPRDGNSPGEVQEGSGEINTDTWVSWSPEARVQARIFTRFFVGYPDCVLPQPGVRYRWKVRGQQYHYQFDPLR